MAAQLFKVGTVNAFQTTLNGSISGSDESITLTTASGLQAPGVLVIDRQDGLGNNTSVKREYISYTTINGNILTGLTRGLAGSSAQAHSSGAIVEEVFSVSHWNDVLDYLKIDHSDSGTHTKVSLTPTVSPLPTTRGVVQYDSTTDTIQYGDGAETRTLVDLVQARTLTPAGTITMYGGAAAPTDWLLCDGSAVSRETYASLFAVIGTAYGVGDNSTTFNLPNLKGRVPVGKDAGQTEFDTLGETGGHKALASHLHTVNPPLTNTGYENTGHLHPGSTGWVSSDHAHWVNAGGAHAHQTHVDWTIRGGTGANYTATGANGDPRGNWTTTDGSHDHGWTGGISANHTHSFTTGDIDRNHYHGVDIGEFNSGTTGTGNSGNLQPYQVVNYIIKT